MAENFRLENPDLEEIKRRAWSQVEVAQEIDYLENWSRELAEQWVSKIPDNLEGSHSETPTIELDLTQEGLGKVFVKDESKRDRNPTGTIKDRMARICVNLYKDIAKQHLKFLDSIPLHDQTERGKILPRHSLLTSGNGGLALAKAYAKYNLPPPKLLLDKHTDPEILAELKNNRADIYLVDLSTNPFTGLPSENSPLDQAQIKFLTKNDRIWSADLTSMGGGNHNFEQVPSFYAHMAKECFNQDPDEIYMPYGGGVLFADFIMTQSLGQAKNNKDKLAKIKIIGAEPKDLNSKADKLTAPVKPFAVNYQKNLAALRQSGIIPAESGIGKISEEEIEEAYKLMNGQSSGQIHAEYSGVAGLAMYIKRKRAGLIKPEAKILVINTGFGIPFEKKLQQAP